MMPNRLKALHSCTCTCTALPRRATPSPSKYASLFWRMRPNACESKGRVHGEWWCLMQESFLGSAFGSRELKGVFKLRGIPQAFIYSMGLNVRMGNRFPHNQCRKWCRQCLGHQCYEPCKLKGFEHIYHLGWIKITTKSRHELATNNTHTHTHTQTQTQTHTHTHTCCGFLGFTPSTSTSNVRFMNRWDRSLATSMTTLFSLRWRVGCKSTL